MPSSSANDGELFRTECGRDLIPVFGHLAVWRRYESDGSRLRKIATPCYCNCSFFLSRRCVLNWSMFAPASDDANQPLLYRKDSDIGFPGSRRRSSASQAKQNSDFTSAGFPATKEDEINSKRWFWNIISILSVSLVGAVIWTSAWKARFW